MAFLWNTRTHAILYQQLSIIYQHFIHPYMLQHAQMQTWILILYIPRRLPVEIQNIFTLPLSLPPTSSVICNEIFIMASSVIPRDAHPDIPFNAQPRGFYLPSFAKLTSDLDKSPPPPTLCSISSPTTTTPSEDSASWSDSNSPTMSNYTYTSPPSPALLHPPPPAPVTLNKAYKRNFSIAMSPNTTHAFPPPPPPPSQMLQAQLPPSPNTYYPPPPLPPPPQTPQQLGFQAHIHELQETASQLYHATAVSPPMPATLDVLVQRCRAAVDMLEYWRSTVDNGLQQAPPPPPPPPVFATLPPAPALVAPPPIAAQAQQHPCGDYHHRTRSDPGYKPSAAAAPVSIAPASTPAVPLLLPRKTKQPRTKSATVTVWHHCGTSSTPEWRRGPDGARTLCNACGLFHAKMVKKKGSAGAAEILRRRSESMASTPVAPTAAATGASSGAAFTPANKVRVVTSPALAPSSPGAESS